MCRILTVVVFLVSICSVLSTSCMNESPLKDERQALTMKLKEVVTTSLNNPDVIKRKVKQYGGELNNYFANVNHRCKTNFTLNTTDFINLMKFSLVNKTFEVIVHNQDCIKNLERDISKCVKHHVGFFNITSKKKHTTWFAKINVIYDSMNCDVTKLVKTCVLDHLSVCKPAVGRYVGSLFDFTLKKCPVPKNTTKPTPNKAPKLSEPVIITLGVGAVLLMQVTHMLRDYATP